MTILVPAYMATSCLPGEPQGPCMEACAPRNPDGQTVVSLRRDNVWPWVTQGGNANLRFLNRRVAESPNRRQIALALGQSCFEDLPETSKFCLICWLVGIRLVGLWDWMIHSLLIEWLSSWLAG